MTLSDLYEALDWTHFAEANLTQSSREALLDCALYLKACENDGCNWKGVREMSGIEHAICEYCGGAIDYDREAQAVFRSRLGDVWPQVEDWMAQQHLVARVDK